MHFLGGEHDQASPGQQGRARKREGQVADRPEFGAVHHCAIGLPDANGQPWSWARHESAGGDAVHRNLTALAILLDHECLADALDDPLDHIAIGKLHYVRGLRDRNRRSALKREASDPI